MDRQTRRVCRPLLWSLGASMALRIKFIKSSIFAALLAAVESISFSASAESSDSPDFEKCGIQSVGASGKSEFKVSPSFNVTPLTNSTEFSLPKDAPEKVQFIQCGRQSIVPKSNDYKVISAGYLFTIVADNRIGVLEMVKGQLQYRMIEGEMTEPERKEVLSFLNKSQEILQNANSSKRQE